MSHPHEHESPHEGECYPQPNAAPARVRIEAPAGVDPLLIAQRQLLALGATQADIDTIDAAAQAEIAHALQVAEAAPWPEVADAYEEIMNSGAGVWK
jgi:pyruvate dehydrogenase E1 component alpha subunit